MTKIGYRCDVEYAKSFKNEVGKFPVILIRAGVNLVNRDPVSQESDTEIADQLKILLPALIVPAALELIYASSAIVYGR